MKARELPLELHLVKHQVSGAIEQLAQLATLLEANEREVMLFSQLQLSRCLASIEALSRGRGGQYRMPTS